ncbi:MAG: hypothetical protein WC637_18255 [Victivallales bacterium]|jgi:tetratricopeptide (TPR) repeat protein
MKYILYAVLAFILSGCASPKVGIVHLSEKELDNLEAEAMKGRSLFSERKYQEAASVFENLSQQPTVSKPLYLNELGSCYLAMGEYERAKKILWDSHDLMDFFDPKSEAQALSLFGSETQKFYRGDPYERAMNSLLLGILFLRDNDVDNALACFNNGILCDSEVLNEEFKSDIFLLYALAAKCYRMRNQEDMYLKYVDKARQAYQCTEPAIRQLLTAKQFLSVSMASNKDMREQIVSDFLIKRLDLKMEKLKSASSGMMFEQLINGDYNTLTILLSGNSVSKSRSGRYGEKLNIDEPVRNDSFRFEVTVDGTEHLDPLNGICDVNFQALTRGGRLMDNILERKASFKKTSNEVSDILIIGGTAIIIAGALSRDGNVMIICTSVGGGMIITGVIIKGVAYLTIARCDIRSWQTLSGNIQVVPLNLEVGKHKVGIDSYESYFKIGETRKTELSIDSPSKMNVIISYP